MMTPPRPLDPLSASTPDPLDEGGAGDEALEAHMTALAKATKTGDARGMATAFRAAMDEWYAGREPMM